MKYLFIILVTILYSKSYCQDSTSALKNQLRFKVFSGWRIDNGKPLSTKNLKSEICKVPAAIPVYNKHKKNETLGYVCVIPGLALMLLSRPVRDIGSPRFGKNNVVFAVGGLIFLGTANYLLFRSNKQLKQAVRIHNESQPLLY